LAGKVQPADSLMSNHGNIDAFLRGKKAEIQSVEYLFSIDRDDSIAAPETGPGRAGARIDPFDYQRE
jgi:hypothetical protein